VGLKANSRVPPGPDEKVQADEDAAELHAAANLANMIVLPRLEKHS
jgi:hypothetical protein